MLEGGRFKDEKENILSEEIRLFLDEPMKFCRPEGGENIADLICRTGEFYQEIIHNDSLRDKIVLISSHGCAVRALLQNIVPCPDDFWRGCVPPNCSMTVVKVENCVPELLELDKVFV